MCIPQNEFQYLTELDQYKTTLTCDEDASRLYLLWPLRNPRYTPTTRARVVQMSTPDNWPWLWTADSLFPSSLQIPFWTAVCGFICVAKHPRWTRMNPDVSALGETQIWAWTINETHASDGPKSHWDLASSLETHDWENTPSPLDHICLFDFWVCC